MSPTHSPIIDAYRRHTSKSAGLLAAAQHVFPSGVTTTVAFFEPYPIYVERAAEVAQVGVDGNEYVDYAGGHGALLLGHNHPTVIDAIARQLPRAHAIGGSRARNSLGRTGAAADSLGRVGAVHELRHRGHAVGAATGPSVYQATKNLCASPVTFTAGMTTWRLA